MGKQLFWRDISQNLVNSVINYNNVYDPLVESETCKHDHRTGGK